MSVSNVGGNYPNYNNYATEKNTSGSKTAAETGKAVETKNEASKPEENTSADGDKFVASTEYKTDFDKVSAMKSALWSKVDAFEKMISTLFQKQGIAYNRAEGIRANLERLIAGGGVSEEERIAAQEAISEDGEWGVNATAERILDFAKGLSGGDPSKIGLLKEAFIKGFEDAKKAWGGELPGICNDTYEKVMQGFDEWENGGKAEEAE